MGDHNLSLLAAKSLGNRSCRHKITSASVIKKDHMCIAVSVQIDKRYCHRLKTNDNVTVAYFQLRFWRLQGILQCLERVAAEINEHHKT